ncbi:TonB-dependent receptor [Bacteroides fragilis]|uniref:TonB-dependent siderophore receptor n=1 Tax=Bacteroides fragilis TaxID=817 RepID=UPI00202F4C54|nr:TonB-dependent receptor [Bacteroides fragilis]MCM0342102.1 TonB-dependent receptor [Bacteroides fragilis]
MKQMYSALLVLVLLIFPSLLFATESESADRVPTIRGVVYDETDTPLASATVQIEGTTIGTTTNSEGRFILRNLAHKVYKINISFVGYVTQTRTVDLTSRNVAQLSFTLLPDENLLSTVEVFGERYKQPKKLDAITRMPLRPSEQIQSISVISEKSIAEQGALTVIDVTKNVPGVTLFGSYGGVRESMSIRGYRGVPILKNGVRIDSDFRTGSALSEMQGVESVQVIKGSAAVTQGIGNDLGSAGGVINVVTKTPKFTNEGEISLRAGSWGLFRPTFDVQSVLDKNQTIAFRMNGAFERSDNYRPVIHSNRVYINPSLEWRPDDKTSITIEMDYLNDNRTPYTSSVNLSKDTEENLYDMPHNKFLGFKNDNVNNKTLTYAARITRQLTDNISVRAAYFGSSYKVDNTSTSVKTVVNKEYNMRRRTISRSLRDDRNSTFQLDFIGRDIFTGPVKHTFQLGFDYKNTDLSITNYTPVNIDTINVLAPSISNVLPVAVKFVPETPVKSNSSSYGIMAQEVMTFNKYIKAILGVRYSYISSQDDTSAGPTTGDAWNPMLGIMLTPIKNINLFGSYTTTTSLLHAARRMENGDEIGPSNTRQFEVGIKSDWLNNRLRFNLTYFDILTKNLSYSTYHPGTTQPTGYFDKAGSLKRKGIETELSGSILENLQVMMGYAYLDAKYENSPAFKNGSAPMNTPKHTANGWIQYRFDKGVLKRLSAGIGVYFVGKRPVNDFAIKPDGHGSMTNEKPFDMPGYTTINAQLAYSIHKFTARVYLNNLFDALGYNSYYRGGYINQIDPRNFSAIISYRF